ncbi:MAG: hypothetical protein GEU90_14915 [Gemmatimonas sp.]|nr:hypothetical protein [Gemmatimonas sp.]
MRRIPRAGRLLATLAFPMIVGCNDRLPTLTGEGPFPVGGTATTIEHFIDSDSLLLAANVYDGPTSVDDFPGLLIANNFDGALNSHGLVKLGSFPDTVDVNGESDGDFTYLESEIVAFIPDTLSASAPALTLELWTVTQPWDTAAVSWENAVDQPGETVPWTEAGGTRGELIATAGWSLDDEEAADTLRWAVPGALVQSLADDGFPGLMVTLQDEDTQVQISTLRLQASISPSVDPDTTVISTISGGPQTFVFTPEPPRPPDVLRVGGVTSDRSIFRLAVPNELPGCPPPETCAPIPADSVILDRVQLIVDPVPVDSGFGPVQGLPVIVRRVLEPELGSLAPLAQEITRGIIPAARFTPAGVEPVRFALTNALTQAILNDDTELAVALLAPTASSFAFGWFAPTARLRILYTLPQTPQLP